MSETIWRSVGLRVPTEEQITPTSYAWMNHKYLFDFARQGMAVIRCKVFEIILQLCYIFYLTTMEKTVQFSFSLDKSKSVEFLV